MKIKKLEDIEPLTIISMRHGDYAVIEALAVSSCVHSLQENEEWQYNPHKYMSEEWEHIRYGIGSTVYDAFYDYTSRWNLDNIILRGRII